MAEDTIRNRLYEYQANSNLVLQAERDRNRSREPTGEVESLRGRAIPRMGDRAGVSRPKELEEKLEKIRKKRSMPSSRQSSKRRKAETEIFIAGKGATVMSESADLDVRAYRPRTRETRIAYEQLLAFVQNSLGDQPQEYLRGAADEVLTVLKDETIKEPEKRAAAEQVLNKLSADRFNELMGLSRAVTDFSLEDAGESNKLDEDVGVAVVFNDEEESEESDVGEVRESEDESDEDEGVETTTGQGLKAAGDDEALDEERSDEDFLAVSDIDAFWLQRELGKYYDDAEVAQQMSDDILGMLARKDEREVENQLVILLDVDKFAFIKKLLKNRFKIYYCTKLKRAQTEEEKKEVEKAMMDDVIGGGPDILQALTQTQTTAQWAQERSGQFRSRVRQEAKRLGKSSQVEHKESAEEIETTVFGRAEDGLESKEEGDRRTYQTLDLETLGFKDGGRVMANKSVELDSEDAWKRNHKGYTEVFVPAMKPKPLSKDERLVPIAEIPEWAQPAFAGMKSLNRIQSKMYKTAFYSADNLLLCAPTGAGKTNVAVLTMLHELGMHRKEDGSFDLSQFKIVYVAPMKALVQECVANFTRRLGEPFGLQVRELSGDVNLSKAEIAETHIIVTTPEKWDIITRKSGERTYTQLVKLLIIDEIHLLHDDRGPVLEAIVARTLRQVETTQEMIRIVGLSATLPNYEDVATFLRVDPSKGLFFFDGSFRPCPLQQNMIGISERKAIKRFQLMNEICYQKVADQAGKNQALIFVHSRKETGKTARALRDLALERDEIGKFIKEASATQEILRTEAESVKDPELRDILPYGFAIHHAGMARSDRTLVEDLFAAGHLQVLCSTATLAWGVNLPAHSVIIKGTQMYSPEAGAWVELCALDVLQMLGRAGRPQYDTYGEGVIITEHSQLTYYLSITNQQLPVESQMIKRLADHLNAEVCLGTVQSLKEGASWLGYTYLYIRMLRNPSLYGISERDIEMDSTLFDHRMNLIHSAALLLEKNNLIKYDRRSGLLQSTALGRVAAYYYVVHPTMSTINEYLKPTMSDIELLRLFSLSYEFRNIVVREEEKLELAKLIDKVPIPVKEGMEEPSAKVNVLLQAYISRLELNGFALVSDMVYIQQSAGRLMRAICEICVKRGWAGLSIKALDLCKMVDRRMWLSQTPLRQFKGVPKEILVKLERKEIPWERYYDLTPQDIGELLRFPKMGKTIHKLVHHFPKLDLQAHVQPITRSMVKVDLIITPDFIFEPKIHGPGIPFWILVEDTDGEQLLHSETFLLKANYASDEHYVTFMVPLFDPIPPQYFIRVVADRWLHSDVLLPISFRHLILPEKTPPPTELLDLKPLPVSALKVPEFEHLYAKRQKSFNPIQTQVFNSVYESGDNVLVAAPSGSGKRIVAEFAVLREFRENPEAKIVYIAPKEGVCKQRFEDWDAMFGRKMGKRVVELTGELASDLKLINKAHIIIATPRQWDIVSRRWKARKSIQNVDLVLVDDLHLVGGPEGPTLEIVVSRMFYVSNQVEKSMRILGLSASVVNARELGAWFGVKSSHLYNFPPQVRPVPLEIRLQSFDVPNFAQRLLSMARPVYSAVAAHCTVPQDVRDEIAQAEKEDKSYMPPQDMIKPALVFVPSRKQAQLTAIDMLTFAGADGVPHRFRGGTTSELEAAAATVKDPALRHTLRNGVAFLHEGMRSQERELVLRLAEENKVTVLIATAGCAWGFPLAFHMVVLMDTQYYEGREHRYVDYPVADVLQMIGLASRPGIDETGRCVIMCHTTRREMLKKFLYEPLPLESHLDHALHDHVNAEVVNRIIESKQDAVDYLTWTFFYRRLSQNPNYYNMQGISPQHLSDHLSELVESVVEALEKSRCITVEDEMDLKPLNNGTISAYYYVAYTTIELFASSLTAKTKLKALLEIVSSASEFDSVPVRHREEHQLRALAKRLPLALPSDARYHETATKVNILLQCHFSRKQLPPDLRADQAELVQKVVPLLHAMVDVISSNGWLRPALAVMELCQMVVQGLWADKDSELKQVPHFSRSILERIEKMSEERKALMAKEKATKDADMEGKDEDSDEEEDDGSIESVYDLIRLEAKDRQQALDGLSSDQVKDVARFCNRFPNVELEFGLATDGTPKTGDVVGVNVVLEREENTEGLEEGAGFGAVYSTAFPRPKSEEWWLVVGDPQKGTLYAIRRITLGKRSKIPLKFQAPDVAGSYNLQLYFMCDSYVGCDQEYEFDLDVEQGESSDESSGEESDEE